MNKKVAHLRDQILEAMLPNVPLTGWTMETARDACKSIKVDEGQIPVLFPDGLMDIVAHFSDYCDQLMLRELEHIDSHDMRIRDRIQTATETRFQILAPHRDAVRLALAYWSVPPRTLRASQIIWRTADRIWDWAGDTSSDYNRYTKRGLLSGILTATTLVWIKDFSSDMAVTRTFLSHRIEHALQFGQMLGKFKRP